MRLTFNDAGQIAGRVSTALGNSAVIWTNGVPASLGPNPRGMKLRMASNNFGDAGRASDDHRRLGASVRLPERRDDRPATLGGNYGTATAINDAGQAVGIAHTADNTDNTAHAFLYQNGVMHDLALWVAHIALPPYQQSRPNNWRLAHS